MGGDENRNSRDSRLIRRTTTQSKIQFKKNKNKNNDNTTGNHATDGNVLDPKLHVK